jgi:hypothetical protein
MIVLNRAQSGAAVVAEALLGAPAEPSATATSAAGTNQQCNMFRDRPVEVPWARCGVI